MGSDKARLEPLPDGFEPMPDGHIAKIRREAAKIGENNVKRITWKRSNKEQEFRGWAATVALTMESEVQHDDFNMLAGFINVAAGMLTYALDSLRFERARAEAAEAKLAALSLACAHCGPESAGPAADNPMACATCYGDLILTDAAGAETIQRFYSVAVGLSVPASVAEGCPEVSDG